MTCQRSSQAPITSGRAPFGTRALHRHRRVLVGAAVVVGLVATASPSVAAPRASAPAGAVQSTNGGDFFVWTQDYQDGTNTNHLVIADADGRHERVLTHPTPGTQDIDPRISPDGRTVLFERDQDGQPSVAGIVATSGGRERTLPLSCDDPCVGVATPIWTPDGRHVVFSRVISPFDAVNDSARSAVLWRSDLDGSHLTRLSQRGIDGAYEDYVASFAPGGYIVFVRVRNSDIHNAVFRMAADGSHVHQLTPWSLSADLPAVSPAASGPTKDLVVFETYGQGPPDGFAQAVATVPATCGSLSDCTRRIRTLTNPRPQSATVFTENFNPAWSPNGRDLVYVHFTYVTDASTAQGDIWTMRYDGSHKSRLSQSQYFNYRPAWGGHSRS